MKRAFSLVLPIMLTTAFTAASAYTVSGTVKDNTNKAVAGAEVTLIKENKSTVTDSRGKFTIHEDEVSPGDTISPGDTTTPHAIVASHTPGYISINSGILSFSQSGSSPVQVRIFDLVGNQVFKQTLYGSGQVDLTSGVKARGVYVAQVAVGSAKQAFRFTANGNYSASFSETGHALLKEVQNGEALRVVAEGFDTLIVPLGTLDTTLELKLNAAATQQTYAFGYAIGNDPTPSKGCGKDNKLKDYFKFTGGGIEHEVYLDLPTNYDKNKPYRLVFGMHCMGGSAQNVAKNEHYYGYRDQKGAKESTIFVAPHGYTDNMPWRCGDNKDHLFFDEILTYLNDNLCVDTSRVFSSGFSFGAMFSNSLAQTFQHRLRGVVVFATADQVIYLPKNAGKPIAWMGTVGLSDGTCPPSMGRSARDRILKNNGPEGHTDCTGEKATEYANNGGHVCYDYKTVDPRFPVKWCTFSGGHQWDMRENGKLWASDVGWEFITQF
ncbi:carboxypeptidase regulatory-like domain-containing protein [Fibrobacter succinogenes]|uniref:carboxypeptidase regulatory-like domain-containing protein n=1 Tax=Fibrobacter succinogenes TaxID=833 RepID=UPI001564D6F6|nr:carboxypeptidase regulatory-like domain-containing protein [Fibrobacter succinogenes]